MQTDGTADNLLTAAELYSGLGYSVIPLLGDAAPDRPKTPALSWSAYQARRAAPHEFRHWFLQEGYQALGIVTGRISSLVVLDFDDPDLFQMFSARHPDLVSNQVVQTRRGFHIYYRLLPHLHLQTRKGQGIDLLSGGCYVVARPSVIAGFEYRLLQGGMPLPLTQYDIERITRFVTQYAANGVVVAAEKPPPSLKVAVPMSPRVGLTADDVQALYRAQVGRGRNNALFAAACMARDHGWTQAQIQAELVALHVRTPAADHAPEKPQQREREALHTIKSAYSRDPRLPQPLPAASPQIPTRARERLYALRLTCVIRTLEGLREMGIQPGQTFTRGQAHALLRDLVGRDSVIRALDALTPEGEALVTREAAPPLEPPPASGDAAEGCRLPSIKKCFFDRVTKPVKMRAGRKPFVYLMPTNSELCRRLGVRFSASDPMQADDLSSARKTRQAAHREFLRRKPGQYNRHWLATRVGISVRTLQRYDIDLRIQVQPMYQEQAVTWDTLNCIPDEPLPGTFLLDDSGKRYPAKREIAVYLLPKVWTLRLMRQVANFYSVEPPFVALNQVWRQRQAQQQAMQARITAEQGRAEHIPSILPSPAALPRSGLPPPIPPPRPAAPLPAFMPPKPAPPLTKRRARRPLPDAAQEAAAQRVYTTINTLTANRDDRISQASARRAVFTYGVNAVERALKQVESRRNLVKPAGFFKTLLRSAHLQQSRS